MTSWSRFGLARFVHEVLRGRVERRDVGALHRELIEALRHAAADLNRGRVLHVDEDARDLRELRPQLLDDVVDAEALIARLEADEQTSLVVDRVVAAAADRRHEAAHVRVGLTMSAICFWCMTMSSNDVPCAVSVVANV